MPQTDDRLGGNGGADPKIKVKPPKKPKGSTTTRGRSAKGKHTTKGKGKGKGAKGAKVKHAPKPGTWHEQSGAAAAAGHTGSLTSEASQEARGAAGGSVLHPSGKGMAPLELAADAEKGLGTAAGLGGVLLDLVGEGTVKLSGVLAAWARESERITNRTWRRPGGLAKLGGL